MQRYVCTLVGKAAKFKGKKDAYRQLDLKRIANVLVPDNLDEDEKFWVDSARALIISLMAYTMEAVDEAERNMVTVAKLFLLICSESREIQNTGKISFFENFCTSRLCRKYEKKICPQA